MVDYYNHGPGFSLGGWNLVVTSTIRHVVTRKPNRMANYFDISSPSS